MRKQTKVVAVASAAALLAIGGAMTSFAAQGWVEEDGTWYFYDKDSNRVEDQWTLTTTSDATTASNWLYFSDPEDGARQTKAWFKVVTSDRDGDDNTFKDYTIISATPTFAVGDSDDETERWCYADGDGNLEVGKIKKIKDKYYGFAPAGNKAGSMLTGLCALRVNSSTGEIEKPWVRDMDSDDLDDAMKTGSVSVTLDGDSYQFQFSKTGGAEGKGRGLNGIDDGI